MIHATTPGMKKLTWTECADVLDLASGNIVRRKARDVNVSMKFGETRWFSLSRPK